MNVKLRLWIEKDNKPVFGDGRYELLRLIGKNGSINKAAKELKMSYRKAWGDVKLMEQRLGVKLVETKTGGKSGGGAKLTPEAHEFLEKYDEFRRDVDGMINDKFRGVFD
ncbi:MAG: hypothetical protein A7316_01355 [Candidatus Altiarchaeales archaeon WOR_SM1_86-2]|nr:MAG: hypothetical protein A7315_05065 [Candidatus Altiarchaeales archaeon WOR_SM1_79]ODS37966.1 MAG: hypothetical protein A7316_01355 [Candidatus Altiarchaeales archaeon WOR_SM1_86-2]